MCLPVMETAEFEFAQKATVQTACEGDGRDHPKSGETQSGLDL